MGATDPPAANWSQLEAAAPSLAQTGRRLLYRGGQTAAGYLATVAADGGPRVHPVFPVIAGGELSLLIVDLSPKYRDLVRNGRYALHSFPLQDGAEEFHLRGRAEPIEDETEKAKIVAATEGRQGAHDFEALFRCGIESVLHTRWRNWGSADAWPEYVKWHP